MTTYIDSYGNELDPPETQALAGERLLDDVSDAIARYCILPGDAEYLAVALWCVFTHLADVFNYAPRVIVRSPHKRSGKTRLLEIVEELVRKPLKSVNASPATLFRLIDEDPEQTILFDEVDAWFTGNTSDNAQSFRGLINAGFQRGGYVLRMGGKNMTEVTRFSVFAPVVMAGIGRLPDTIEDRSVLVMMRRRAPHEKVDSYRLGRDRQGLRKIHDRIVEWAKDVRDIAQLYAVNGIDMPVDDRHADVWEPLLIVAQLAGGNWPDAAREACRGLCSKAEAEDAGYSEGQLLLHDIREIFGAGEFIRSADLVAHLKNECHESPWFDEMLTTSKLAAKLRAYGIHPRHSSDKACRGYWRIDFRDAWARYLPEPSEPSEPSDVWPDQAVYRDAHSDTGQVREPSEDEDCPEENPSSGDMSDTLDTPDGPTEGKVPTPRDVAEAKKRAKGKEISESGKYAPRQQIDLGEWA